MAHIFFPQFKKGKQGIEIDRETILDAARKLGIYLSSECGGKGICGRCRVRVEGEKSLLSPPTRAEKEFNLSESERLACQTRLTGEGNIRVFLKQADKYTILSESLEEKVTLDPFVYEKNGKVFWEDEELDKFQGKVLGLAIDVGTTTLVSRVVDLQWGKTIATFSQKNPQCAFGDDVISRIEYTMRKKDGVKELQKVLLDGINEGLKGLLQGQEDIGKFIYEVVVVGNPTMRNLFFGINVSSLGVIPFEPSQPGPLNRKAKEIGLRVNPNAHVYGAPLIGGHAGADALANVVATEIYKTDLPSMIVDIGTNGEVVIGNKEKLMSASCAAGGAYEGATVGCGLGAVEGAIKNIKIEDGKINYETIGGKPAVGVCGSGLIDLLSELLKSGIMSKKAKLKEDFIITKDIKITQQDIYQLITAKAGLRTDQDLLIKYYGVSLQDIDKIYLSGAFGNFINIGNAIIIGLLPKVDHHKIVKIGNGALAGARKILLSREKREEAEQVARKIEHVKPNEREKDFAYLVAQNMYFEDSLF